MCCLNKLHVNAQSESVIAVRTIPSVHGSEPVAASTPVPKEYGSHWFSLQLGPPVAAWPAAPHVSRALPPVWE